MIACMGGFCPDRETCADYQRGYGAGVQSEKHIQIVERLCQEPEPEPIGSQRANTQWSMAVGQLRNQLGE